MIHVIVSTVLMVLIFKLFEWQKGKPIGWVLLAVMMLIFWTGVYSLVRLI